MRHIEVSCKCVVNTKRSVPCRCSRVTRTNGYLDFFDVRRRDVSRLPGAAAGAEPPVRVAPLQDQKAFFSGEMERVGLRGSEGVQGTIHCVSRSIRSDTTRHMGIFVKVTKLRMSPPPQRSELKGAFNAWPDRCVYLQRRSKPAAMPKETIGGACSLYASLGHFIDARESSRIVFSERLTLYIFFNPNQIHTMTRTHNQTYD